MNPVPRLVWLLLAVGLGLRLVVIQARPVTALAHAPDEREYYELAWNLAQGEGFSVHGEATAYRSVFMPALASLVMRVAGYSPRPFYYLQALLSCATALLLYQAAIRRFGPRGALFIAAAWLFLPNAILGCALFLTDTVFVFLWTLALVLYDRLQDNGFRAVDALGLGLATGAVSLTRSVGLCLLVALVLYLLFIRSEQWRPTEWRMALTVLAGAAVITVPWMARNAFVTGRFQINTNSGIAFLLERAPRVGRDFPPPSSGVVERRADNPFVAIPDPVAGIDDSVLLETRPLGTLALWSRKLVRLWATNLSLWTHYTLDRAPAAAVHQLRHVPVALLLLLSFPTLLAVSFGFTGLVLIRRFMSRGLYLLQLGLLLVAILFTYSVPRDVTPFLPALLVSSAALGSPLHWNQLSVRRRLLWVGALAVICFQWVAAARIVASW